jgi:anti-sigma B factor antagonist
LKSLLKGAVAQTICSDEDEMELRIEQIGDVTVVQVCAESLSANNVKEFKSQIAELVKPYAKIVLDMSSLKFVDSSGIGALLSWMNNLRLSNGSLSLCNVTKSVRNLFELVRVHRFLQVFGNREEAVRSLGS